MSSRVAAALVLGLAACGSAAPPPGTVLLPQDPPSVAQATPRGPAPRTAAVARPNAPPQARVEAAPPPPPDPGAIPAPPDVAAPPAAAQRTPSGLATVVLRAGSGRAHPGPSSRVSVHYTGWTTDGRMFDSSVQRGSPFTAGLGQVIAGFSEGIQLMVEGEQRRLWIPENLAYGGRPGAPQGMLVFDVELLQILP